MLRFALFALLLASCGTPVGSADVVIVVAGGDCTGEDECAFDFGQVPVNTNASNTFTIKNDGKVGTDLTSVAVSGDPAFTASGKAVQLAAGGTTTVIVNYTPPSVSSSQGALVITWDQGKSTTSISLTGSGK
jgi:hypothetical protein